MNLTLQIIVQPAAHDLSYDSAKAARRYAVGDVVDVWDADVVAPYNGTEHLLREPIANPRFVFVHVRGVPDRPLERVKLLLCGRDVEIGSIPGPDGLEPAIVGYYRRRRWGVVVSDIPAAIRNRLQSYRQITVTWTQVKNYLKNVRANTLITDSDLS